MNKYIKYVVKVNGKPIRWHTKRQNAIETARIRKADMFRPNDKIEVIHISTKQPVAF